MVAFLVDYAQDRGWNVETDRHKNVIISKGSPESGVFPMMAAHIDSVQPLEREINVRWDSGVIKGYANTGEQIGFGADDKTGIFVCLKLMDCFPAMKLGLFAGEEEWCVGAHGVDPIHFRDVGYVIEWDCPGRGMLSYTSGGVRVFDNAGPFIKRALPALDEHGVLWQRHPYTDIRVLSPRFKVSCLNLASGYYNWHDADEYVKVEEVEEAVALGYKLVTALGNVSYPFVAVDTTVPPREIVPFKR